MNTIKLDRQFFFLIILLFSSCVSTNCPPFDYESFDIDTCEFKEEKHYINKNDTLIFKSFSWVSSSKFESTPNFFSLDECLNGFEGGYSCDEINFAYNFYFYIGSDNTYKINYFSDSFDECFNNINNAKMVSKNISLKSNHFLFIKEIHIQKGILVKFIDYKNNEWILE